MVKKNVMLALTLLLTVSLGAGCSSKASPSSSGTTPMPTVKNDPVTLTFYIDFISAMTDEEYSKYIEAPLKTKFPYLTLEKIRKDGKELTIDKLMAAGKIPDIIYTLPEIKVSYVDAGVPQDLTEYIKKYNTDLNKFEPGIVNAIKKYGPKNEVFGLPFSQNSYALWYNKDIFDKFGVSYPKDGMTWEEAIDMGKKVTRTDDKTQYLGLGAFQFNIDDFASPLGINYVDTSNDKAIVSDKWKDIFSTVMTIYNISGNRPSDKAGGSNMINLFVKDQRLAMAPTFTNSILVPLGVAETAGLHWDVAQLPSFKEAPNTYNRVDYHQLMISSTGKNKDLAFQVINFLTSKEVQQVSNRNGLLTTLNDAEVKKQFADDISYVKGKHIQSIFKSKPAPYNEVSPYKDEVKTIIHNAFKDVYDNKTDINSALRMAEEKANARIADLKKGK